MIGSLGLSPVLFVVCNPSCTCRSLIELKTWTPSVGWPPLPGAQQLGPHPWGTAPPEALAPGLWVWRARRSHLAMTCLLGLNQTGSSLGTFRTLPPAGDVAAHCGVGHSTWASQAWDSDSEQASRPGWVGGGVQASVGPVGPQGLLLPITVQNAPR